MHDLVMEIFLDHQHTPPCLSWQKVSEPCIPEREFFLDRAKARRYKLVSRPIYTGGVMGRNSLAKARRSQIIQAFYRCVAAHGLAKTSMRMIAREAGVQPSALHHYFKDRDEMIEEMVDHYTNRFFYSFLEEMARYDDLKERLDKAADFLFSPAMINEEATGFFYDCCSEAKNNPRVRQSLARLFRRFRKTILEYFSDLAVQNGLNQEETQDIATLIIAVHEGVELQWHMSPEDVSLERSLLLAKRIIKTFLPGQSREGLRRAV